MSIESFDINDLQQVEAQREQMILGMPDMLGEVGLPDQAEWLRNGRHAEFVTWFRDRVAVGNHGVAEGGLGLTPETGRIFNPFAQQHGLMSPMKLWAPGDDIPAGAYIGDVADYQVEPDYDQLSPDVFVKGNDVLVAGATVSGLFSRITTGIGVLAHMPKSETGEPDRLGVLSGMRRVRGPRDDAGPDEGANGIYRQFLPKGTDRETPVQVAFPTETDAATAIVRSFTASFIQANEIPDPQAGNKPPDRRNELLATPSRQWIARVYQATLKEEYGGRPVEVTIMNGEPIMPTAASMNRSRKEPAPLATETFKDWLAVTEGRQGKGVVFTISYAHLARIAAELQFAANSTGANAGRTAAIGKAMLVGCMPQAAVWNSINQGLHNGPTMGFKEVYPLIMAFNALLGRNPNDLGV